MKIISICNNSVNINTNTLINNNDVFFMCRPETTMLLKNRPFYIPEYITELFFGVELAVKINRLGKYIEKKFAAEYYNEAAICIDFTAQNILKNNLKNQFAFDSAKNFDFAVPLSKFYNANELIKNDISVFLNNEKKYKLTFDNYKLNIDEIIAYISQYVTLKIGDVITCGSTQELLSIKQNETCEVKIDNDAILKCIVK